MKRLIMVVPLMLFCGCKVPHRLVRNERLFTNVDSSYNFSSSNVFLQTADRRVRLINPVIEKGKIVAEAVKEPYKEKNLIFIYQKKYNDVVEPVLDSSGNPTNFIRFSNENITRIDLLNKQAKIFKRKRLYHPHPYKYSFGRTLMYIGMVYLGLGFIVILAFFAVALAQGCYIATMVYSSHDAPEVLVLRSYRDEKLAPYFFGRVLIGAYYRCSPLLVHVFKNNRPVNDFIRSILDRWVVRIVTAKVRKAERIVV
jgi:hypothetical protein